MRACSLAEMGVGRMKEDLWVAWSVGKEVRIFGTAGAPRPLADSPIRQGVRRGSFR